MPLLRGNPSEFLDETYPVKRRRMGLLYGENCIILRFRLIHLCDRQTDRQTDIQTDGRMAVAYNALSICCRVLKMDINISQRDL